MKIYEVIRVNGDRYDTPLINTELFTDIEKATEKFKGYLEEIKEDVQSYGEDIEECLYDHIDKIEDKYFNYIYNSGFEVVVILKTHKVEVR